MSGIPGDVVAWEVQDPGGLTLGDQCAVDGVLYNKSGGTTSAYRLDTGSCLWRTGSSVVNDGFGMSVFGGWCCSGYLILDKGAGHVVVDYRDLLVGGVPVKYGSSNFFGGGFVKLVEGGDEGVYCYYPEKGFGEYILRGKVFERNGISFVFDDLLVGIKGACLKCVKVWDGSVQWAIDLPLARNGELMMPNPFPAFLDGRIYCLVNKETVWCIDIFSGKVVWKNGPDEIEERDSRAQCVPAREVLVSPDAIYVINSMNYSSGSIQKRSLVDGSLDWKIGLKYGRCQCAVGDLLYGMESEDVLVAWDRYTGEKVWQAKERMTAAYSVLATGNHVIYTNTVGTIRCYKWETPYQSPGKG